jgi:hypothetical protein
MKIKHGMGGSRCGKSRWHRTEELKTRSKKLRRSEAREQCTREAICLENTREAICSKKIDTRLDSST